METITVKVQLEDARWVGKSRPVIKNTFRDATDTRYTVFSTRQAIKGIRLGEVVEMVGEIAGTRIENGATCFLIKNPYITEFDTTFD